MSKQNAPELRMDGFEGEWCETTIGKLSVLGNGRDYKHLNSGNIPVYGTGGYMLSVDAALSNDRDAVGIGRKGTIDNPYLLRAPFWTVDTLFYVIPNIDTDLGFLHATFQTIDWKTKNTASGVPSLTSEAVTETEIPVPPTLAEQQSIGAVFTKLDTTIASHKKKLDLLKQTKTSLLQRLFPQDGATVPELRLDGFEGEWEVFPLFDVVKRIIDFRGRTPKKLGMDWSKSGHLALSANNVKQGFIDFSRDPHYGDDELYSKWMSGRELHEGQVLFTTEAPLGNVALVPDSRKYILSQRVIAFVLELGLVTESFFAVTLTSPGVLTQFTELSSGGTAKGISQRSLENIHIVIPRQLEEQRAIGAVFSKLDTLITAEAQYIDKLTQTKTALLQKMFV